MQTQRDLPEQSSRVGNDEVDVVLVTKLSNTHLLLQTRVRQNYHLPYKPQRLEYYNYQMDQYYHYYITHNAIVGLNDSRDDIFPSLTVFVYETNMSV